MRCPMAKRFLSLLGVLCMLPALVGSAQALRPRVAADQPIPVNPAPGIVLTGPSPNTTFNVSGANVQLAATATDETAVTGVDVACTGATTIASTPVDTFTPAASVNVTKTVTLNVGVTHCTVIAHDGVNDSPIDFIDITYAIVDSTAPTVAITYNGGVDAIVTSGPIALAGTVTDAVGVIAPITWSNSDAGTGGNLVGSGGAGTTAFSSGTGVPLQSGPNHLTVRACDANQCGTASILVTLNVPLAISQTSISSKTAGVAGSFQLTATGGSGTKVWDNGAGSQTLAANVTINASTGLISWTSAVAVGNPSFNVRVVDSSGSDTNPFSIDFQLASAEGPYDFYVSRSGIGSCATSASIDCVFIANALRTTTDENNFGPLTSNPTTWQPWFDCEAVAGDTSGDLYADKQDACKRTQTPAFYKAPQTRVKIQKSGRNDVLIVVDEWRGPEFRSTTCNGVINVTDGLGMNYKSMNLYFGPGGVDGSSAKLVFQFQTVFTIGNNAQVSGDCTLTYTMGSRAIIAGVPGGSETDTSWACYGPNASPTPVGVHHSTMARHWYLIRQNVDETAFAAWNAACNVVIAPGTYHQLYEYVWEKGGTLKTLIAGAPISRTGPAGTTLDGLAHFTIEDDTSTNPNPASGQVTFTGTSGTIPQGALFTLASNGFVYKTTAPATINGGVATAPATSANGNSRGPNSNMDVGTTLTLNTPIANISSTVTVSTAFTGGSNVFTGNAITYWRGFLAAQNVTFGADPTANTDWFKEPK